MVKYVDNTDKVLESFETALGVGLNLIGQSAAGYTQDNTPVRTGNLANSIDWEVNEKEKYVVVGFSKEKTNTNVKYAVYVEEGSSKTPPRHMLRKAATEHTEEYKKLMKESMKNA